MSDQNFESLFRFAWGYYYNDVNMPQRETQQAYYHQRLEKVPFAVLKQALFNYIDKHGRLGNFPSLDQLVYQVDIVETQLKRDAVANARNGQNNGATLKDVPQADVVARVHMSAIMQLLSGTMGLDEAITHFATVVPERHPKDRDVWEKTVEELGKVHYDRMNRKRFVPRPRPRIRQPDPMAFMEAEKEDDPDFVPAPQPEATEATTPAWILPQ